MAWPMGVVVPYARHMSHGLREWALKRVMEAMREPRASPSKVSVDCCQYWLPPPQNMPIGELTVECDCD